MKDSDQPESSRPKSRRSNSDQSVQELAEPELTDRSTDRSIVYFTTLESPLVSSLGSRERLIEAGWRVIDNPELAKVFAAATTALVSKEAGVTTGSFFHHFRNSEEFARAMAHDLAASLASPDIDELTELPQRATTAPAVDLEQLITVGSNFVWAELFNDPVRMARFRIHIRLWTHHRLQFDDSHTIADLIADGYRRSDEELMAMWAPALESSGMEVADPFTFKQLMVIVTALNEGLTIRATVDPEAVPDGTLGETIRAFINGALRPAGAKVAIKDGSFEVVKSQDGRSPQARSGAQRRIETRRRIVAACGDMFGDGWETVSATDIANRAEVSTQTITNLFGSVRAVAAVTFAGQARAMYQNALAGSTLNPVKGLNDSLMDLTVRARIEPEIARALLAERLSAVVRRGGSLGDMDVRLEVPISGAIGLWLARLGVPGDDIIAMSTMLANFILSHAITSTEPADVVVATALRLIPKGVTSNPRSARY